MSYLKAWRPTPSFVVSCISLFVALSGSAIALQGQNGVKSDDIAKGAVHTADIAKNAINSAKVKNASLQQVDFAPGTLLQGPQGPQGPPGPAGGGGGGGGAPSGPAGGALAGTYPNPTLATNAITADGTGSDGTTKIAPNSIGFSEMNDNSVHSAQIFNGAVTGRTLGPIVTASNNATNATTLSVQCPAGSTVLSGGGIASTGMLASFRSNNGWLINSLSPGSLSVQAYCLS